MKTIKIIPLLLLLLISSCASITGFSTIDNTAKTITMPPGAGLTSDIKVMLRKNNWKTMVDQGPSKTTGTSGQNISLDHYDTFHTRYRMYVDYNQYDVCFPKFDPAYNFNLAIVDNQSGEEVMNYGGQACRNQIIKNLEIWLKENTL